MKKQLLPLLFLLFLVNSTAIAQASYNLRVGGTCSRATLSMFTNTGAVEFNSDAVFSSIDIGTHYFGFTSKFGTFRSQNQEDARNLDKIFNLNFNLLEFTPDNPSAGIKELNKGQSVNIQIPGLLRLSNVRVPITLPVTFSRDNNGMYHFTTDFTLNATLFGNKIPDELKDIYTGAFRIQLAY